MQTDALLHFCGFLCVIYQKLYFLILGEVEKKKKKKFSIVIHVAGIVNWMIKTQSNLWGLCEFIDENFSWCSYDVFITDLGKLKLNNLVFAMLSHNVSTSQELN